jgi:hypothetical protein
VEGDVAGDGGRVLRRGAGRRLHLVRRAHRGVVVGNSPGERACGGGGDKASSEFGHRMNEWDGKNSGNPCFCNGREGLRSRRGQRRIRKIGRDERYLENSEIFLFCYLYQVVEDQKQEKMNARPLFSGLPSDSFFCSLSCKLFFYSLSLSLSLSLFYGKLNAAH